jgi:hypothetical protein
VGAIGASLGAIIHNQIGAVIALLAGGASSSTTSWRTSDQGTLVALQDRTPQTHI